MLINLGYKEKIASSAVMQVKKNQPEIHDIRDLVKAALKIVSGRTQNE